MCVCVGGGGGGTNTHIHTVSVEESKGGGTRENIETQRGAKLFPCLRDYVKASLVAATSTISSDLQRVYNYDSSCYYNYKVPSIGGITCSTTAATSELALTVFNLYAIRCAQKRLLRV